VDAEIIGRLPPRIGKEFSVPGLTPDVVQKIHALLHEDQILLAIKVYRDATGVSLAEAKAAVERMSQNEFTKPPDGVRDRDNPVLEARIKSLLGKGRKVEAVKIYREEFGVGLKEAKDAVDRMEASMPRDPASSGSSYEPAIGSDPFADSDGRLGRQVIVAIAVLVAICGAVVWFLMMNL
jgi:ribosomal protein L7/L12